MSVWTLKCKESLLVLGDKQFNTLLCCHDPRIAQSYSNDTAEYITPYPLYPTQKLHPPVFSLLFFHHFALFHFPGLSPLIGFDNALSLSCTPLSPWEKWSSCFAPSIPARDACLKPSCELKDYYQRDAQMNDLNQWKRWNCTSASLSVIKKTCILQCFMYVYRY